MTEQLHREVTLPSVIASLAAGYGEQVLSVTVLFHPDTSRIGEYWEHSINTRAVLDLGRLQPAFGNGAQPARPLNEAHVSRRALQLEIDNGELLLVRQRGACRCRLQGCDLREPRRLDAKSLVQGMVLQLGHAVVLWLHAGLERGSAPLGGEDMNLIGGSAAMCELRRQVLRAAGTDLNVLVLGESGAGKEEVAGSLHAASRRARSPLVSVNMAAIPIGLAPALLFGSARGAYTGAGNASRGYFQQAERGTLFLDEIGATPLDIQPQLLRALQQRQIQVVGGAQRVVDVRVIAATDADIDGRDSGFSAALRHRLGSLEIQVPPLRRHREDIGELLLHFLQVEAEALNCPHLLPDASGAPEHTARWAELFQRFARYSWSGNVRELLNAVRQLLVSSEAALTLPEMLETRLQEHAGAIADDAVVAPPVQRSAHGGVDDSHSRPMATIDAERFRRAHVAGGYEVAATARALSVSRQAVYRRLSDSGEFRLAVDVPEKEMQRALDMAGGDVQAAAAVLEVSARSLRARLRSRTGRG
ncbi:MAG: sigma 54-interacting transcriptional regulator [Parahaliea sp.]